MDSYQKKKPQSRGQAIRDFNIDDEIEGDYQTSGWLEISPSPNKKIPNIAWGSKEEPHDTDIPKDPNMEVFPRKSLPKTKADAEANPDMSPEEWLQWYKKRPKKKSLESIFKKNKEEVEQWKKDNPDWYLPPAIGESKVGFEDFDKPKKYLRPSLYEDEDEPSPSE